MPFVLELLIDSNGSEVKSGVAQAREDKADGGVVKGLVPNIEFEREDVAEGGGDRGIWIDGFLPRRSSKLTGEGF